VALAAHPHHPTAAFNLGTALEELGRPAEAIAANRHALEADPDLADAHFNLARLYEQTGKRAAALRHLKAYKQLSE
jgi:tetratricopeptide (TPR) repeat protein